MKNILAIVEFSLVYPYQKSAPILIEFANIWRFGIIDVGTFKDKGTLSIPRDKFKQIFHSNPQKGGYEVPSGAESFVESVLVKDVIIK